MPPIRQVGSHLDSAVLLHIEVDCVVTGILFGLAVMRTKNVITIAPGRASQMGGSRFFRCAAGSWVQTDGSEQDSCMN